MNGVGNREWTDPGLGRIEAQNVLPVTGCNKITCEAVTCFAEFSDTEKGYAFRIRIGDKAGDWQHSFSSFAVLEHEGKSYRLCSSYWVGTFPIEQVFIMKPGRA